MTPGVLFVREVATRARVAAPAARMPSLPPACPVVVVDAQHDMPRAGQAGPRRSRPGRDPRPARGGYLQPLGAV